MSKLGEVCEQTTATQTYYRRGLGAKPPAAGRFFVIFWKKSYANAIDDSHSARVHSQLNALHF